MKFESKAHMAQELMAGKKFRNTYGDIIHYDSSQVVPFMFESEPMLLIWDAWEDDIWEEVKPRRTTTVYEWMLQSIDDSWYVTSKLMTVEDAAKFAGERPHRKTGRSWEVEV
jgi:hypothetical protein